VDSITDAVEGVIHRSTNHPGALQRFLLQGIVRRVLRDIHGNRTPLRRSSGSRPSSSRLEARHDARYSLRPVPRLRRVQCRVWTRAHRRWNMPSASVLSMAESPSLVLVINDTKLLMPCVKCFELGISNTCDEGVCGKEW
jgi:hypothetical protein